MGVICHGNDPSQPLLDGQSQADALRTLKHLVRENPFSSDFTWVKGHAVERKGIENCTLAEKLNDTVDTLTKKVLISGVTSEQLIDSRFPVRAHPGIRTEGEGHWLTAPHVRAALGLQNSANVL